MTERVGLRRLSRAAGARAGLLAVALLVPAALGVGVNAAVAPTAASAAEAGACTDATGVTVVVDFPGAGNIHTRCAGWPVSSGLDALTKAGFSTTPVQQQPQFVCRIDGVPAEDRCVVTPPGDAFWSYWTAQRGGSWAFSATGAASSHPAQGAVEGWAFGAGNAPEASPPESPESPVDPPSSPPPPPPPPPAEPEPEPSESSVEPPGADDATTDEPAAEDTTAAAVPSATATAAPTTTAPPSSTASATGPAAASTDPSSATFTPIAAETGGSSTGTLVAIGVVLALGAAAGVTAWRRRSAAA